MEAYTARDFQRLPILPCLRMSLDTAQQGSITEGVKTKRLSGNNET